MKFRLFLLLSLPLLFFGCNKDTLPGLSGDIIGYVKLFDEFGNEMEQTNDYKVQITLRGFDGKNTINSRDDGRFIFKEVPTGTYDLVFEKQGYGTYVDYSLQHIGGSPTIVPFTGQSAIYYYMIGKVPTNELTSFAYDTSNTEIVCTFQFNNPPKAVGEKIFMRLRIFYGFDLDVSPTDYFGSNLMVVSSDALGSEFRGYFNITAGVYDKTIYYVGYIDGSPQLETQGNYYYTNIENGLTVYPTIAKIGSNVLKIEP